MAMGLATAHVQLLQYIKEARKASARPQGAGAGQAGIHRSITLRPACLSAPVLPPTTTTVLTAAFPSCITTRRNSAS